MPGAMLMLGTGRKSLGPLGEMESHCSVNLSGQHVPLAEEFQVRGGMSVLEEGGMVLGIPSMVQLEESLGRVAFGLGLERCRRKERAFLSKGNSMNKG